MEVETAEGTSMKAKYWNKRKKMKAKSNTWENNVKMKCPRILPETYLSVSADHVHELSTIAATYHCSRIWCPNLAYSREANDLFLPFKKRNSVERHLVLPRSV